MVADPRITPRDRQIVAALRSRPAEVDPVEYAAWVQRPEIQRVLAAMRDLERRRDDQARDTNICNAIDALNATIKAHHDLSTPLKCAETRRAATTILQICTLILRGTPTRSRPAFDFNPDPADHPEPPAQPTTIAAPRAAASPAAPRAPYPPSAPTPHVRATPARPIESPHPLSFPDSPPGAPSTGFLSASSPFASPPSAISAVSAVNLFPPPQRPRRTARPAQLAAAAGLAGPAP